MDGARRPRAARTALAQVWLTIAPLLALVVLWPGASRAAPAGDFAGGAGIPFDTSDASITVIIETHAPVVLDVLLVLLGIGMSIGVVTMSSGPVVRLRRLSILGRVGLVVVALAGGVFASLPVQAHLLGWDRGELPTTEPWWSNARVSWFESH